MSDERYDRYYDENGAEAHADISAEDETGDKIELTAMTRKKMGVQGCQWYDSLSDADHMQLRNAYIDKVLPKMGDKVTFESWILLESKLAIRFKGKEDRTLRNTQRLMKRKGIQ